jgi:parvulin-like peptidyl-prolyl isomerase
MHRSGAPRGAVWLLAAALLPAAAPAQDPTPPVPSTAPYELRDRIVAVVDEDPILASDVERVIALGLANREPGESQEAFSRRVLEGLIDQRLRAHEIDRFGLGQVDVKLVDEHVAEIRSRFESEEAFRRRLEELDLDLEGLRQLVARQLSVLEYVNERLAIRVFITLDEINEYYEKVLVPQLRAQGAPVPPIEEVREDIRELLREQRLNREVDTWTEQLRREADVSRFPEEPKGPLPPVVETIDEP